MKVSLFFRLENIETITRYAISGTGPATLLAGVEALGFISTKFVNRTLDNPDVQFHFTSGTFASDGVLIANGQGVGKEQFKRYYQPLATRYWSLTPRCLREYTREFKLCAGHTILRQDLRDFVGI